MSQNNHQSGRHDCSTNLLLEETNVLKEEFLQSHTLPASPWRRSCERQLLVSALWQPSPFSGQFCGREGMEVFLEDVLFPEFESLFPLCAWWLISRYGVDAAVTMGRLCLVFQDGFAPPPLCVNTKVWPYAYFVVQHTAIFTSRRRLSPVLSCCEVWGLPVLKAELLQPFSRIQGLN